MCDPELGDLARHAALDPDVVRLVVARLVAGGEDGRELVEGERPVGRRVAARARPVRRSGCSASGSARSLPGASRPFDDRHRARERAADDEAAAEHLTHVAHLVQVLPDEARRAPRRRTRRARSRGSRRPAAPRTPTRPRAGPTRSRSARPSASGCSPCRRRRRTCSSPGACSRFGSEWKPPLGIVFAPHATRSPPSSSRADLRVRLQLLEQVVDGELDVAVVEPDDHARS